MKKYVNLFISIPTLILGLATWLVLALLGWILIPIMAKLKRYHYVQSRFDPNRKILLWKDSFMKIWGNDEDGIDWYANKESYVEDKFQRIINWSCKRNAVGNHRFYGPLKLVLDPSKINYIASKGFERSWSTDIDKNFLFIAWQDNKSCIRIHYNRWRIWFGWKILPADIDYIFPEWRKEGVGIAKQVKKMRHYF